MTDQQRRVQRFREIVERVDKTIPACPSVALGLPDAGDGIKHISRKHDDD